MRQFNNSDGVGVPVSSLIWLWRLESALNDPKASHGCLSSVRTDRGKSHTCRRLLEKKKSGRLKAYLPLKHFVEQLGRTIVSLMTNEDHYSFVPSK